jgi:hypothetical protein
MQNTVIRVYPATAAIAHVEDEGQFIKCLGEFSSVEAAVQAMRVEKRPMFVEDCLFGASNRVPRYRVGFAHGAGTPEYVTLSEVGPEFKITTTKV